MHTNDKPPAGAGRVRCAGRALMLGTALALLAACASVHTDFETWKAENYHQRVHKVMVVALSPKVKTRRMFEYALVERLQNSGVTAVPSVDLLPLHSPADRDAVKAAVERIIKDRGFDALLVTHLHGVERTATYVSPTSHLQNDFDRHFLSTYSVIFTPGYTIEDDVVSLETNLYDAATGQVVWSMTSRTFNPLDASQVVEPVADHIVTDLSQQGLLAHH